MRTGYARATRMETVRVFAAGLVVTLAVVLGTTAAAHAAPGDLDTTFSGDGKVTTGIGSSDHAYDVAIQGDGRIVVAGRAYNGTDYDFALTRYNSNGSLDTTFSGDGKLTTDFAGSTDQAHGVAIQGDGKIVAVGRAYNGADSDFALARYNPNGALDTTFSGDGKLTTDFANFIDSAWGVAIQGDGKIVAAGQAFNGTNGRNFALARYNPNGTLDTTFSGDGKLTTDFAGSTDSAQGVAIQGDKILAVGYADDDPTGTTYEFALARYNSDGSLDTTFRGGGKFNEGIGFDDVANAAGIQADGKIVVGGQSNGGGYDQFVLRRYKPDGTQDSFGTNGTRRIVFTTGNAAAKDLAIQPDGKIVAAGYTFTGADSDFALARVNPNGGLDNTFSGDGKLLTDFGPDDFAPGVAIQPNGRIVAAGSAYNGAKDVFALARYYGGDDATAPTVKPPRQALITNSTLGKANIPVRLSWSATDSQSGVSRYELQQSKNGGSYANVKLPNLRTTKITRRLSPNSAYRFRVRAHDNNGNLSSWRHGPTFRTKPYQEAHRAIKYHGAWKYQRVNSAYGKRVKYAKVRGATARLVFRGRNVTWVAPKSRLRGKAVVFFDGRRVAVVDLRSRKALARKAVFSRNGLNPSVRHTVVVKVLGTKGRPRVDVDAFVVLR